MQLTLERIFGPLNSTGVIRCNEKLCRELQVLTDAPISAPIRSDLLKLSLVKDKGLGFRTDFYPAKPSISKIQNWLSEGCEGLRGPWADLAMAL
jgi:hypothetical protein